MPQKARPHTREDHLERARVLAQWLRRNPQSSEGYQNVLEEKEWHESEALRLDPTKSEMAKLEEESKRTKRGRELVLSTPGTGGAYQRIMDALDRADENIAMLERKGDLTAEEKEQLRGLRVHRRKLNELRETNIDKRKLSRAEWPHKPNL